MKNIFGYIFVYLRFILYSPDLSTIAFIKLRLVYKIPHRIPIFYLELYENHVIKPFSLTLSKRYHTSLINDTGRKGSGRVLDSKEKEKVHFVDIFVLPSVSGSKP